MWNITIVYDSMSKQFSKEKGDKMLALPATVGGLSVDIPVGTVRGLWVYLSSRVVIQSRSPSAWNGWWT